MKPFGGSGYIVEFTLGKFILALLSYFGAEIFFPARYSFVIIFYLAVRTALFLVVPRQFHATTSL